MSNDQGKSDIIPTESKTTRTIGNFSHGSRETPSELKSELKGANYQGTEIILAIRGSSQSADQCQLHQRLRVSLLWGPTVDQLLA